MLTRDDAKGSIVKAMNEFEFDKVSDLSKDEFADLLAASLVSVLDSRDFIEHTGSGLVQRSRQHRR